MLENIFAPFGLQVITPKLTLAVATDEHLAQLAAHVHAGHAMSSPLPYDDPISFYEDDPDIRVRKWLEAAWRNRGSFSSESWRLSFAVIVDGKPIGMQDVISSRFSTLGTLASFSWLSAVERRKGLGREMRSAILQLAFAGLNATEAHSDAFVDNVGSNRVSESLGYERNGMDWDTRRGTPAQLQRWRIDRAQWEKVRRDDIEIVGLEPVKAALQLN